MNIVQMHEQVRFWLDTVNSPRHESTEIDLAINLTTDAIIVEKYDNSRALNYRDAFQKTQKVRDQLGKIVERWTNENGKLTITNPLPDRPGESSVIMEEYGLFRHLLLLEVVNDLTKYVCFPLDYDKKGVIERNPFRRPRIGIWPKIYHTEESGNLTIVHPENFVFQKAFAYVLRQFVPVFYGNEIFVPFGNLNTPGEEIISTSNDTMYDGLPYRIGEVITVLGGVTNLGAGSVVRNFVNCELNITLHEEISRRSAVQILRSTGQTEKVNMLLAEFATVG